jgi:hypothetical protein
VFSSSQRCEPRTVSGAALEQPRRPGYADDQFPFQEFPMSTDASQGQQQKIQDFLRLLPLTIEIAGLPRSELGRNYNEGQMEVRVTTLRTAYKLARQFIAEIVK